MYTIVQDSKISGYWSILQEPEVETQDISAPTLSTSSSESEVISKAQRIRVSPESSAIAHCPLFGSQSTDWG